MGGHHLGLEGNAEVGENLGGVFHHVPVAVGPHDHTDEGRVTVHGRLHRFGKTDFTGAEACLPSSSCTKPEKKRPDPMIDITQATTSPRICWRALAPSPCCSTSGHHGAALAKQLGPQLEALEAEYAGRFVLAKLNADDEPQIAGQLSQMFGVRSIPFCVMFMDGQPVDGFVGALPPEQIREFLDKHVPAGAAPAAIDDVPAAAPSVEDITGKLLAQLQKKPDADEVRFELVAQLLQQGLVPQAAQVFEEGKALGRLIVSVRLQRAQALLKADEACSAGVDFAELDSRIAANRRDFDARLLKSQALLVRASAWRRWMSCWRSSCATRPGDEAPRKTYVAILEWMAPAPAAAAQAKESKSVLEIAGHSPVVADDPVRDSYRRKLSMALF